MSKHILTLGLSAQEWVDLLKSDAAKKAQKSLAYLDGRHEEELIKVLNDPNVGKADWQKRGVIPRFRNVTRMVIEKSAQLFKDQMPTMELYNGTELNQADTEKFKAELDKITAQEIFINADEVLRLLKTVVLLYQYDPDLKELVIDILHRGNSQVMFDGAKNVQALIYTTSENTFRIYTNEEIIDLMTEPNKDPIITFREPNPYGTVPASVFYDTRLPRDGFWNNTDYSLINLNESLNLHLTELDFLMRWTKSPTLFLVDCEVNSNQSQRVQEVLEFGEKLTTSVPSAPEVSGGPGVIVHLQTNGQGSASVSYQAPNVNITPMTQTYEEWCGDVARDWSVRINTETSGNTSGFSLLVESIPNIELRQQRQKMWQAGFKRAWVKIRRVLNVSSTDTYNEETVLFAEFGDFNVPVNPVDEETLWDRRIEAGRATVIDYFMQVQGLSKEEAEARYLEITKFNLMKNSLVTAPVAVE